MTFEKDAVVLEKNKRLENIFWALSLLTFFGGIAQAVFASSPPFLLYLLTLPLGLATRVSTDNWRSKPRNARVRASADGVTVDGKSVATRGDITSAVVQPRVRQKPTVRLRHKKRGMLLEMVVEDEAEGFAFLRAIGHDAAARKADFKTMSPLISTPGRSGLVMTAIVALCVAAGLALSHVGMIAGIVLSLLTLLFVVGSLVPRDVAVGADGLTLTWHRRRRFVPWDDVRALETPAKNHLRIVLASGKRIDLRMASGGAIDTGESALMRRDAFLLRIREAIEAHRSRIGPRELAAQLMPGAKKDDWLTDLKKIRDGEGGYRAAAVREEDLWRVVEDPGAPEEARAAAAVLLRKTEGAGPRLRIAADAVASPRLRVALEAEEEEQAEEALKAYLR